MQRAGIPNHAGTTLPPAGWPMAVPCLRRSKLGLAKLEVGIRISASRTVARPDGPAPRHFLFGNTKTVALPRSANVVGEFEVAAPMLPALMGYFTGNAAPLRLQALVTGP